MELNESQRDALTELINIGYGRAAGALSELTGYRINLEVPTVAIHPVEETTSLLREIITGDVASVNQVFSGPVAGHALLLLDERAALLLTELLTDEKVPSRKIDTSVREIITEVGNILLNACLGVFGNQLKVQVTFSVPRISVDSIEGVLNSITVRDQEMRYALMIHMRFHLRANDVKGYMVILLGVSSLERLMSELKQWEERQVA
jgi:chemotaxis protein CheC